MMLELLCGGRGMWRLLRELVPVSHGKKSTAPRQQGIALDQTIAASAAAT
jgi:hypothetical protein